MLRWIAVSVVLLPCLLVHAGEARVWVVDVQGTIGPATADHMVRGVEQAAADGASAVVLRIDTPGGLDSAMRSMVKSVIAAPIPVVGYVSPSGARAASAGTYLLYATHIAAMAPGTNLGAATPVRIGGLPTSPGASSDAEKSSSDAAKSSDHAEKNSGEREKDAGGRGQDGKSAMERKIVNDAVAYIRSLAQLRGRNAQWAERAVREGVSLSADDALELGVIDMKADSLAALLRELDGRRVRVGESEVILDTGDAAVHQHALDWRSEFLAVITDPNVAYILMLLGIYGLIFEFSNPGFGLPGLVGVVSLMLALYAFQVLPVSYAGLGLMLVGVALMVAEAFAPSFGIMGGGGIVAFVFGSIMLMDTEVPGYSVAMPLIAALAVFSAGLLILVLSMLVKARRREVVTGAAHLVGRTPVVERFNKGKPLARLDGELWHVDCAQPLHEQDRVCVDAIDGLTLKVSRQEV